ncbi:MAG: CHAT domain-containing protein [Candidatus Helarchaeota archaeon]
MVQSTENEKALLELLEDYYKLDNQLFSEKLEKNFKIFEKLDEVSDPRTRAIGKFLYSVGLSMFAAKLQSYKFYEMRMEMNQKANQAIQEAYDYFKNTDELKILEHIYDQLIFLLWERIPFELVLIDEKLKLIQTLIEYCKKQEEISEKLGDEAFLTKEERIPYRYSMGEFRYLLEKATLSREEAIDSNEKLKEKIMELENYNFPKAKFWARKWKRRHVCEIEKNTKISYFGGTLVVEGDKIEFKNDSFNRAIKLTMYVEPQTKIIEQKAYPDVKVMRSRVFFSTMQPTIERIYEDGLKLEFTIERPIKSREDAFERDTFSITPKKSEDIEYMLVIETSGEVDVQEHATLIIEKDITLRVNDPALEITKSNGITTLKFNLIKKVTESKGPKELIPEREELDYLGYGKKINFTLYCNINPTFSGTFIFTDPSNWKYCLAAALYMNKLKFKQEWYPSFLNFDYSPILFLENGKIPQKVFNKVNEDFTGFLKDIGREFPGLLEHIIIFGEFMGDLPLEKRKAELMELLQLLASISHLSLDEESVIRIITSNKQYYEEMVQLELELNKINQKLTNIYKSKIAPAIKVEYQTESEFISSINMENKRIYDQNYEEVYLIENPLLAFVLIPLVKYTKSAILTKDEIGSDKAKQIFTKAKKIWALGDFKGVKIPKKVNTELVVIKNEDIQEDILKINEIFKKKIREDYKKYEESDFLRRIYPGYTEEELLENSIVTSVSENDFSFLIIASNYAANKPATMTVIEDNAAFNKNEKEIIEMLSNLRFSKNKMIYQEDIEKLGIKIKQSIHPLVQKGLETAKNIIIITKIPIPFELYYLEGIPLCISKAVGRVCSTDIIDTSIMLTLNMMRRMIMKVGEKILIIAPKYEGDLALPEAIREAAELSRKLKKIFKEKVLKKIDEIVEKEWILKMFQEPLKIIHFSGHGDYVDNKSCLILSVSSDGVPIFLYPEDLEKMIKESGLIKGYPLVFTSACITGQIKEASSGLEGLAAEFIKAGATCFIGTLWEIMDESAHEFASYIYNSLNEVDKDIGEILLESRKKLHKKYVLSLKEGEFFDPTCYAFVLFGDPTITIK